MNCTAIVGAMDEEVLALAAKLEAGREVQAPFQDLPIWEGRLAGQDVVLVRCGIGKVNAALATQYVIDRFQPGLIINSGVAGGLGAEVKIGDVVIGTAAQHHDFSAAGFGYPQGVIPRLASSVFQPAPKVVERAVKAAVQALGAQRVHRGLIVSGDQFVSSPEHKDQILEFFPGALCVEMEGAAIAHVAALNNVPHLIIRAISDQADNTAPTNFDEYLLKIIPDLNGVVENLLRLQA